MSELRTRIAFEALVTERHGMLAENEKRRRAGKPILYVQSSFDALASQMRDLIAAEEKAPRRPRAADGLTEEERMLGDVA